MQLPGHSDNEARGPAVHRQYWLLLHHWGLPQLPREALRGHVPLRRARRPEAGEVDGGLHRRGRGPPAGFLLAPSLHRDLLAREGLRLADFPHVHGPDHLPLLGRDPPRHREAVHRALRAEEGGRQLRARAGHSCRAQPRRGRRWRQLPGPRGQRGAVVLDLRGAPAPARRGRGRPPGGERQGGALLTASRSKASLRIVYGW
mmetsp:Transcript_80282/g.236118  ORF Transcript_80282/g.236118 Transcript_80282/m.236118 type:complete len:202 (-) Transcript_80282:85-690(-)